MPNVLWSRSGLFIGLLCSVAMLSCVAGLIYSYGGTPVPAESMADLLSVEQAAGEHPADSSTREAPFEIHNRSRGTVTVVGFTGICVEGCCARVRFDGPVTLKPGERGPFVAEFKLAKTGPFVANLQFYVDSGTLSTSSVVLKGTGR